MMSSGEISGDLRLPDWGQSRNTHYFTLEYCARDRDANASRSILILFCEIPTVVPPRYCNYDFHYAFWGLVKGPIPPSGMYD